MLNFIDIASWQSDIDLSAVPIDAVIIKATEAEDYVNPYCDPWVNQAKELSLPWGFYHFGRNGDPVAEADYFISQCEGYFGEGIPVLDWEDDQSVDWVNSFINHVHDVKGVWCVIYANPCRFNQGGVERNCGRWIASYPSHLVNPDFNCDEGDMPDTDGLVCAWQFASDGDLDGYNGNLDLNRFYGDINTWNAYAGAQTTQEAPQEQQEKATPAPEPEQVQDQEQQESPEECTETHHVVHLGDTIELAKE